MVVDIGQGVKRFRKDMKLNQLELAKKSGVARSYISDLENGRRSPTTKTINKILENFNLSYIEFLVKYCDIKDSRLNLTPMEESIAQEEMNESHRTQKEQDEEAIHMSLATDLDIELNDHGYTFDGTLLDEREMVLFKNFLNGLKEFRKEDDKAKLIESRNK